jgi:hypothetical protein
MPVARRPARFLRPGGWPTVPTRSYPSGCPAPAAPPGLLAGFAAPLRPARSGRGAVSEGEEFWPLTPRQVRSPEPRATERASRDRLPSANATRCARGSLVGGECGRYRTIFKDCQPRASLSPASEIPHHPPASASLPGSRQEEQIRNRKASRSREIRRCRPCCASRTTRMAGFASAAARAAGRACTGRAAGRAARSRHPAPRPFAPPHGKLPLAAPPRRPHASSLRVALLGVLSGPVGRDAAGAFVAGGGRRASVTRSRPSLV